MKNFLNRMELVSLWSHYKVDFTNMHTDNKSVATLDHCLISPRLLSLVSGAGVIHRGDNMSRHSPIWLKLDLGILPKKLSVYERVPIKSSWSPMTTLKGTPVISGKSLKLYHLQPLFPLLNQIVLTIAIAKKWTPTCGHLACYSGDKLLSSSSLRWKEDRREDKEWV